MNKKQLLLLPILLLLLMACVQRSGDFERTGDAAGTPDPVTTPTPRPTRPVQNNTTIVADGVIKAAEPVLPLSFETGGKVTSLNIKVGDVVQAGDVLATLDDSALQEAIANAQLQVAQAENSQVGS